MASPRATPELDALIDLFYDDRAVLGDFQEVADVQLPDVARRLLAHDQHMTVTVEDFHVSPVLVQVLQTNITATHYARKIVLRRQSDDAVVLFGLVRLNFSVLSPDIRAEIESQQTPLGHILISHNVLRTVRLLSLWRVTAGHELCQCFGLNPAVAAVCYGRTALIYCDGVPAVELLEIIPE